MKDLCLVFAAGEYDFIPEIEKDSFIIAADGGEEMLRRISVVPDVSIGDFDSLKTPPTGKEVISFPVKKDDTDTLLALKEGIKRGFTRFKIYGALGGSISHTTANLQALSFLCEKGLEGSLIFKNGKITATKKGLSVPHPSSFSVFALSGEAVIDIDGALYSGTDINLTPFFPLGVSNKTKTDTKITVKKGIVHIFEER